MTRDPLSPAPGHDPELARSDVADATAVVRDEESDDDAGGTLHTIATHRGGRVVSAPIASRPLPGQRT